MPIRLLSILTKESLMNRINGVVSAVNGILVLFMTGLPSYYRFIPWLPAAVGHMRLLRLTSGHCLPAGRPNWRVVNR